MCDVCGRSVPLGDEVVADLSAAGDLESPLSVVVHSVCFEMGRAILGLSGLPVAATTRPSRTRR